jgi:hypothetical protein
MAEDFRKEFDQLRPMIRKQWIIIFIPWICFVPFLELVKLFNPTMAVGNFLITLYILFFVCFCYWWILRIKCPNCNKSLYVYKYVWKIPIIVLALILNHCPHCGVWLKGKDDDWGGF